MLWCDGRRTVDLPPGRPHRGTPRRQPGAARPAARGAVHRPAGRQVRPAGRGLARRRRATAAATATVTMLEEIRIGSLGVIESSTLELGPGLTVITGETGAGKTMIVTALGLLLGGRADTGAVRTGAEHGPGRGRRATWRRCHDFAAAVEEAGGEVEDDRVVLARNVSAEGRSRAFVGGASVPVAGAGRGRRAAGRGARPVRPAPPARPRGPARRARPVRAARGWPRRWRATSTCATGCWPPRRELAEVVATARERAREADLLRFGLDEIEAVEPQPGEDAELAAEEARLGLRRHAAHRRRDRRARRSPASRASPTPWRRPPPPGPLSTASATTTPRPASWPTGWPS